jgi:hypothetical protein
MHAGLYVKRLLLRYFPIAIDTEIFGITAPQWKTLSNLEMLQTDRRIETAKLIGLLSKLLVTKAPKQT